MSKVFLIEGDRRSHLVFRSEMESGESLAQAGITSGNVWAVDYAMLRISLRSAERAVRGSKPVLTARGQSDRVTTILGDHARAGDSDCSVYVVMLNEKKSDKAWVCVGQPLRAFDLSGVSKSSKVKVYEVYGAVLTLKGRSYEWVK